MFNTAFSKGTSCKHLTYTYLFNGNFGFFYGKVKNVVDRADLFAILEIRIQN